MRKALQNLVGWRRRRVAGVPSEPEPDTFPAALVVHEISQLREKVNHLAIEMFHLTNEVEELRRRIGTGGRMTGLSLPSGRPSASTETPPSSPQEVPVGDAMARSLESFPSEVTR
jgi:hypothetical protein